MLSYDNICILVAVYIFYNLYFNQSFISHKNEIKHRASYKQYEWQVPFRYQAETALVVGFETQINQLHSCNKGTIY